MTTQSTNPVIVAFTLDFETGGLKCQTAACTQIAIHATRLDTFEKLGSYVSYIAPYRRQTTTGTPKRKTLKSKYEQEEQVLMDYEEKALEYSAISMDMLYEQGKELEVVAKEVVEFIASHTPKVSKGMKPFLIGQNVEFDKGFFMQLMEYTGLTKEVSKYLRGHEDYYGHWQPVVLDSIVLGQLALCNQDNVHSYKLELMCERLGVDLFDAHDADADVEATTSVVAVLTQRMRNQEVGEGAMANANKPEEIVKHFKI